MRNRALVRFFSCAAIALLAAAGVASLHAQDKVGYLRTRISPREAGVFVDGKYYGTAAMFGHRERMIKLSPGTHVVEIKDPRYKTLKAEAKIEAGKTATIREYMDPLGTKPEGPLGELTTDGFGNAAIYINGDYYANTLELQNPAYSLLLKAGDYDMKIVPVDGEVVRAEKITINADEVLVIYKGGGTATRK
jgi:PEGA domain